MEFNRCYGCMEEITAFPCPHCGYAPGSKGPDYALRPGSILYGKYLVGRILGQGGFGITYVGWDLMLDTSDLSIEQAAEEVAARNLAI